VAVRIVHYGDDVCNQVAALREMGYSVSECVSLAELHAAMVGVMRADAVAIAESNGTVPDQVVSLVRATSAVPLILFQSENPQYSDAEFDLVIPCASTAEEWADNFAELIARSIKRNH
jgi:hypothetical protein